MTYEELLFIDIETVPICEYEDLSDQQKKAFAKSHCKKLEEGETEADCYWNRASLFPEYAKIICVSIGFYNETNGLKMLSITGDKGILDMDHEAAIIEELFDKLKKIGTRKLCGHNIKNFDIPFICKRAIINGQSIDTLPNAINFTGKKPREIDVVDSMDLWKFGGGPSASLENIVLALGIDNPKSFISGSDVKDMYYDKENRIENMEQIKQYCEGDVKAVFDVIKKLY